MTDPAFDPVCDPLGSRHRCEPAVRSFSQFAATQLLLRRLKAGFLMRLVDELGLPYLVNVNLRPCVPQGTSLGTARHELVVTDPCPIPPAGSSAPPVEISIPLSASTRVQLISSEAAGDGTTPLEAREGISQGFSIHVTPRSANLNECAETYTFMHHSDDPDVSPAPRDYAALAEVLQLLCTPCGSLQNSTATSLAATPSASSRHRDPLDTAFCGFTAMAASPFVARDPTLPMTLTPDATHTTDEMFSDRGEGEDALPGAVVNYETLQRMSQELDSKLRELTTIKQQMQRHLHHRRLGSESLSSTTTSDAQARPPTMPHVHTQEPLPAAGELDQSVSGIGFPIRDAGLPPLHDDVHGAPADGMISEVRPRAPTPRDAGTVSGLGKLEPSEDDATAQRIYREIRGGSSSVSTLSSRAGVDVDDFSHRSGV